MSTCPEFRPSTRYGFLVCTEEAPHPTRSHDFWPATETEAKAIRKRTGIGEADQ